MINEEESRTDIHKKLEKESCWDDDCSSQNESKFSSSSRLALPSGFRDIADASKVLDTEALAEADEIIDTVSSIHSEESDG